MEERNTPIERPPMLGFKQSKSYPVKTVTSCYKQLTFVSVDLHMFYQRVTEQGGYDGCVSKKVNFILLINFSTCYSRPGSQFMTSWEETPRTPALLPALDVIMRSE